MADSKQIILPVTGMTCANCALTIHKYLEKQGMKDVRVNAMGGDVSFEINGNKKEEDLAKGNLFATGLVAGGALAGVIVAILSVNESISSGLGKVNAEEKLTESLGVDGYKWLAVAFFALMGFILYRVAISKRKTE